MDRRIVLLFVFLGFLQNGFSQAALDSIYNTNSPLYPTAERIAYYEQMYRFRVHRLVDLNEKQNSGFRSKKSNIGGLIINLIKEGKLKPFGGPVGDAADFDHPMPDSVAINVKDNIVRTDTRGSWNAKSAYQAGDMVIVKETDADTGVSDDIVYKASTDNTGQEPTTNGGSWTKVDALKTKLDAASVLGIEIIEEIIFDKRKSRLTYDILAIGVNSLNPESGETQTRSFIRYADLCKEIDKISKSPSASERASVMWQNRYNPSENKKFTDAFKLRLFHGVILKVENPDDQSVIETVYQKGPDGKGSYAEGVFAMWEEEMKLMEKEHNLWEY